jgi:hypothetical protein
MDQVRNKEMNKSKGLKTLRFQLRGDTNLLNHWTEDLF